MNDYQINQVAYFEYIIKAKRKLKDSNGKDHLLVSEHRHSGHYEVIAVEKDFIMIKDEDIELPVAKKNIKVFQPVNNSIKC